jgi:hypothetical protein
MLVDVTAQLDRTERLLRQLLQAKTGRRSEQLSREQLALFATELGITLPETEDSADDHDQDPPAGAAPSDSSTSRGRKPLPGISPLTQRTTQPGAARSQGLEWAHGPAPGAVR